MQLTPQEAQHIIRKLGESGIPPIRGLEAYTVGIRYQQSHLSQPGFGQRRRARFGSVSRKPLLSHYENARRGADQDQHRLGLTR